MKKSIIRNPKTTAVLTALLVAGIEILKPEEVDDMTSGQWPLTLFTCTYGGASRVTVRCEKENESNIK